MKSEAEGELAAYVCWSRLVRRQCERIKSVRNKLQQKMCVPWTPPSYPTQPRPSTHAELNSVGAGETVVDV